MKERKVSLGGAIVGGAVALVFGVFVGTQWNSLMTQFGPYLGLTPRANEDWSDLNSVYGALKSNFDGDLDKTELVEGAKRGLVEAAGDDYTIYMSRKEAGEFNKSLHGDVGSGIGVEMGLRDGWVKVLRTLPDNPAREAGVLAGDIFYKVDGEDVSSLGSDEVANRVRGAAGSKVSIVLIRDGEEFEYTFTREPINNVSAYLEYKGDYAVLTISRFDTDTGAIVRGFAKEITERGGVKGIILDLRGNGGGYVNAAKDVLSLWVDGKLVLSQRSRSGGNDDTYANRGQATLANMKTVVLINGSSASASEIVAGALKDYGLATLVGEKTFGKGSVQSLVELDGGELLKVTTARWYTPEGKNIDGEGIEADVKVERTFEDVNKERDPQMDKALETVKH